MFPEAFNFSSKVLSFAIPESERESEHASSSKNFPSTSKRALILFLRAIRAKALLDRKRSYPDQMVSLYW